MRSFSIIVFGQTKKKKKSQQREKGRCTILGHCLSPGTRKMHRLHAVTKVVSPARLSLGFSDTFLIQPKKNFLALGLWGVLSKSVYVYPGTKGIALHACPGT